MGKFKITASITVVVDADDKDEAFEVLEGVLDPVGCFVESNIDSHTIEEVPYVVPPGAERWAEQARAICFEDDKPRRFGAYDGSWWWTNGHVALRCEGDAPVDDGKEWRQIEDAKFTEAFMVAKPRKPTLWSKAREEKDGHLVGSRSFAVPDVAIQKKYLDLVAESVRVRWLVGNDCKTCLHAVDSKGKLVAIVMPMRASSLPRLDATEAAE